MSTGYQVFLSSLITIVCALVVTMVVSYLLDEESSSKPSAWGVITQKEWLPPAKGYVEQIRKVDGKNMNVWVQVHVQSGFLITLRDSNDHRTEIFADIKSARKFNIGDTVRY